MTRASALALVSLLAACASPTYVDAGKSGTSGPLDFNPVTFQVHTAFETPPPDCIAILPLAASETGDPRPTSADAAKVRLSLFAHLATQSKRGIRPERVDRVLAEVGGDRKALAERLKCPALIEGTVTEYGNTFLGIYSSVTVGADLRMIRAHDGAVLWEGRHVAANRDGAVPLDPVGIAMGVFGAVDNIRDEQVLRVTDDLARRLVFTIPDTAAIALDDPGEAPPSPAASATAADPLAEAERALSAGDHRAALAAADKAIAADGGNAEAWFLKGRVLMLDGDAAAAEPAVLRAAALNRANPRYLNAIGAIAAERGDAPRALAAYRMAIDTDPANGFAWYNSGILHLDAGERGEAADAFYGAALAYVKQGEAAKAERALGELRQLSAAGAPELTTIETALATLGRRKS